MKNTPNALCFFIYNRTKQIIEHCEDEEECGNEFASAIKKELEWFSIALLEVENRIMELFEENHRLKNGKEETTL